MKRNRLFTATRALLAPALLVLVTASAHADATQGSTALHPQVTAELKEFKRKVFEMRREADTLHSFTPSKRMHWKSHTTRLDTLKQHVNDLGKRLAVLESLKPMASERQQLAIDHARFHLVPIAQNLTQSIEMINEDRRSVHQTDYAEAVRDIYAHADSLHQKVGTVLDYERAKIRLDNLELQPIASAEGS
jgi:hypothetical protein